MRHLLTRRALAVATLAFVTTACGGGSAVSTQRPSQAGATQQATSAPIASSSSAPTTAVQPTVAPPAGALDACALATVEEVATAVGTDVTTAAAVGGDETTAYCNYSAADGSVSLAVSLSHGQAFVFDSYAASTGSIAVPGIGDAAVATSQGVLFIKSGDTVVGIQPLTEFDSPQDLIAALTPLAQAVAGRL